MTVVVPLGLLVSEVRNFPKQHQQQQQKKQASHNKQTNKKIEYSVLLRYFSVSKNERRDIKVRCVVFS